jgi:hypothetical protein
MFCLFLDWRDDAGRRIGAAERDRLIQWLRSTPHARRALLFTPETASDPYLNDGASPPLALQLYFSTILALEAAVAHCGHLQALAAPDLLPSLAGVAPTQQAMLARRFTVPEPGEGGCTYLVSYEGEAEDLNAWLSHYLDHHPPLMARFPAIRELEVCTRLDWCSALPFRRAEHIQRNKVVFDSTAALTAALASPVRHEMRADFNRLPPYSGPVRHYPMATFSVVAATDDSI